jgi:hypothetical protein
MIVNEHGNELERNAALSILDAGAQRGMVTLEVLRTIQLNWLTAFLAEES